jgi:superkiller protein 3
MKLVCRQTLKTPGLSFLLILLCSSSVLGQVPSRKTAPPQSQSQKIANPLNDLLDEAQRDIDGQQFQAAIAPLQKFIAEKPDLAYAHFQLAYAFTALKHSGEARAEYERAVVLDPKMAEAWLNLGILLLNQNPKAPSEAIAPLKKAVDLLPAQSRPRSLLAIALDRSGDEAGAAESFQAVLHLDPNDFTAIHYLGDIALRQGKPVEAEARFRRAQELQPTDPAALKGLAESLDAQKKPEALAAYRAYLLAMPRDSETRSRLIHLLIDEQQYEAALADLDHADSEKGPSLDSLRLRADIQVAQKKLDDAIVTLQRAIAMAPEDPQLKGGLGRIYLQKRDFTNAEKQLAAARQIDRNNLTYWKDLSSTYYLSGNFRAALATLDVIAKTETPGAGTWFIRALCYDKLSQTQLALDAYQKFLAMEQGQNSDQVWQAQQRSKVLKKMLEKR